MTAIISGVVILLGLLSCRASLCEGKGVLPLQPFPSEEMEAEVAKLKVVLISQLEFLGSETCCGLRQGHRTWGSYPGREQWKSWQGGSAGAGAAGSHRQEGAVGDSAALQTPAVHPRRCYKWGLTTPLLLKEDFKASLYVVYASNLLLWPLHVGEWKECGPLYGCSLSLS